jgi:hypothetical protein
MTGAVTSPRPGESLVEGAVSHRRVQKGDRVERLRPPDGFTKGGVA